MIKNIVMLYQRYLQIRRYHAFKAGKWKDKQSNHLSRAENEGGEERATVTEAKIFQGVQNYHRP
jgi:hypothetical protein